MLIDQLRTINEHIKELQEEKDDLLIELVFKKTSLLGNASFNITQVNNQIIFKNMDQRESVFKIEFIKNYLEKEKDLIDIIKDENKPILTFVFKEGI